VSVFEVTSRITMRSLMGRTKYELASLVMMILDAKDAEARGARAAPEGWRLVPTEPTETMRAAGFDAFEISAPGQYRNGTEARDAIYRAYLAAAPTPLAEET
jgi:hypothetical protein